MVQVRLEDETAFEGAPVRGDMVPGTVVKVLVGKKEELERRGHKVHLTARLADSGDGEGLGSC